MEKIRPPTADEQKQIEELSKNAELAVREALQNWAQCVFQLGFAAGVTKALETPGLVTVSHPSIVI